jgi:beta-galactosidase GanA
MVQVENEPGVWNSVRDHSPEAERVFQSAVPADFLAALGRPAPAGANWSAVFGADADEDFGAWSVAHYIGQVAAAGKAEYPLPMYVNAALRDPLNPPPAANYEAGGPTDNVLSIWRAAAPAVDILSPDIYLSDGPRYQKVLELYARPDNPLFVPETIGMGPLTRYCFAAIGHGAIGWAPFGIDYTTYGNTPAGGTRLTEENLAPLALNFQLLAPMGREIARLNFEGRVRTAVEEKGGPTETLTFGAWKAVVSYGVPAFGAHKDPKGNADPIGRVLIAQTGANEFLVAGYFCRVDFQPADPASTLRREYRRVVEGSYSGDAFHFVRIWNGDQTDYGLNFTSAPQPVRVELATY